MHSLFVGILTVLMVLDCVFLVLLVLIQLPKKEAGAGLAFGGAATDALFGAGSGNVLTKLTKYVAGAFFGLAVVLAILSSNTTKPASALMQELGKASGPAAGPVTSPATGSKPALPAVKPVTPEAPVTVPTMPVAPVAPAKPAAPAPAPATNK